jgi:AAHS family 4-hydroxybenzoate transporter-like MFS transporter
MTHHNRASRTIPQEGLAQRVAMLCGLVLVLEGYDLSALGYVVPPLSEAWRTPPAAFTPALTAGNAGMFLGALLCGWLGDTLGRKPVLLGCVAVFGAASILTAFVDDPWTLTAARLVTGIGLGGGIPLCIALLSDFSPKHRQGAMVIAMMSGVVVGNLLAGIVAAYMLAPYGWQSIFLIGGLAPVLFLPLLAFMLPESPAFLAARATKGARAGAIIAPEARPGSPVAALFAPGFRGATLLLWVINFLNLLTIYFVNSWLPAMLRGMGTTSRTAILATSMFHVGAIVAAIVGSRLVGRFGLERVLTVMLSLGSVCILLTGLLHLSVMALGCFVLGFGFGTNGAQQGISALPGAIYPTPIRSTGAGWATGFGRLGNISGALLGGLLLSFGWSPQQMLLALAAAPLANAFLMAALGRARRSVTRTTAASTEPAPQHANS